jgi:hypothetical protein
LKERYVREWLGSMVTSDIVTYDAEAGTYAFPQEHALPLTGQSYLNNAPTSRMINHFGSHLQRLASCF